MKLSIKEITNMKNGVNMLSDIIYNNFSYLSDRPELQHNVHEIQKLLTAPDTLSFVVYNNDSIIAYLVGEYKKLNDGRVCYYISYVYVCEKYRGKKIGTKLMNLVIDKCKNNNIKYLLLTCDTQDKPVYEFYEKMGFVPDTLLRNYGRHEVMTLFL